MHFPYYATDHGTWKPIAYVSEKGKIGDDAKVNDQLEEGEIIENAICNSIVC